MCVVRWVDISLVSVGTLFPVDVVTGILVGALLWTNRQHWRSLIVAAAVGAGLGALVSWWVGDVLDALDVSPTWVDRVWFSVAVAVAAAASVALVRGRWARRVVAGATVAAVVLAGGLAVNRDAGFYPTAADALGLSKVPALIVPAGHADRGGTFFDAKLWQTWSPPADMPREGRFGAVRIPGTVSHFRARRAIVYLPPAALVPGAPALPVTVMMSGQGPGAAPANVIEAGRMVSRMNEIARNDRGLAPIVVIPDQLRFPVNNPMCVDGRLGNSATYLTVDVPEWIRTHLKVETSPRAWTVAGFSQGGTCAIQLGAEHPSLFGSLIDVSGQLGPVLDSVPDTVHRGFGGSAAAYRAAQPEEVMRRHGLYGDSAAFFAVGQDDSRYGPVMPVMSAAARRAGMTVSTFAVPGSGHDWACAGDGLEAGIAWLMPRMGLTA